MITSPERAQTTPEGAGRTSGGSADSAIAHGSGAQRFDPTQPEAPESTVPSPTLPLPDPQASTAILDEAGPGVSPPTATAETALLAAGPRSGEAGPGSAPAAQYPSGTDVPRPAAPLPRRPPLRIVLTLLQLAACGMVAFAVFGMLLPATLNSMSTTLLLPLCAIMLACAVYVLFGIAWFESTRVTALYGLEVAPLRWQPQGFAGFAGWLRMLGAQMRDWRMWRALGSFAASVIMGSALLALFQWMVGAVLRILSFQSLLPELLEIPVSFAGMIGLALLHRLVAVAIIGADAKERQLTEQVRTSSQQRAGAVRAADVERTRIERDLHDGVQPRLVSVAMTLGLAQQKIDDDPESAKALVDEAHTSTKAAITELRQLARGIYASVLDDRGLDAALSALAARSHIPVHLDVRLQDRCQRDAEAAVYFAIAESLTNAAKHSRASEGRVVVRLREDGTLWARVEDNGIGGARVTPGGGLDGVMNRVLAAGGTSRLDSPQGGPTALEVSVPCAS